MYVCWSLKGGNGTTVVVAALSIVRSRSRPTLAVDLRGDVAAALGVPDPAGPGLGDWLSSHTDDGDALLGLAVEVLPSLHLLPPGALGATAPNRWHAAAEVLAGCGRTVVVDAGVGVPHEALLRPGTTSLLVTRACYLSLRRAPALCHPPAGVVLLTEHRRAIDRRQVASVVGAPIAVELPWDPAVYRAVDSGLLTAKLPPSISGPLSRLP